MRDESGLLLTSPLSGLGYQTAGALQRLGRRMTALLPSTDAQGQLRAVPMPTHVFDWQAGTADAEAPANHDSATVLLSPDPELARNEALSGERFARLASLVERLHRAKPGLLYVSVLPWASPEEHVQRALDFGGGRGLVLLAPALYGFRDANLMDRALDLAQERPGALAHDADQGESPLLSAGDAAAFVSAATTRADLLGKVIWIPAQTTSLKAWLEEFRTAFDVKDAGWIERLRSGKRRIAGEVRLGPSQSPRRGSLLATEVFPSPLTRLARSLREMAGHRKLDPQNDLIFPAARGL